MDAENTKKRPHPGDSDPPAKKKVASSLPFSASSSGRRTLKSTARPSAGGAYKTNTALIPSLVQSYSSLSTPSKPTDAEHSDTFIPPVSGPRVTTDKKKNLTFERSSAIPTTDFTLKSAISIISPRPMTWLQDENSQFCYSPLESSVLSSTTSSTSLPSLSPGDRFRRASFYYRFPASVPLQVASPTAPSTVSNGEDSLFHKANPYMAEIRKSWSSALESAAKMVLSVPGRTFTLFTRQFSLFVANVENGAPVACVNQTTFSFRRKMNLFGVNFTLPLASAPETETEEDAPLTMSDRASIDGTPQSLLLVRDKVEIMQLIAFFVQLYQGDSKWLGICPTITSYFPFLHGSLCQLESSVSSSMLVKGTGFEIVHTASLAGIVMPEAFLEICAALQAQAVDNESFNLNCTTVPQTHWNGVAVDASKTDTALEIDSSLGEVASVGSAVSAALFSDKINFSYNIKQ